MADRLIRIGRVSKIDYEHGMISVTYPDLDDSVTVPLSTVSFNDEYKMPQIGDEVLAVHLPSGQARGLVLGKYWNTKNTPANNGPNLYRKEYGHTKGTAYSQYTDDGAEFLLVAPEIRLTVAGGTITVSEIIEKLADLETRVGAIETAGGYTLDSAEGVTF